MPLLNKKPFVTKPAPPDLDENEEIFVCRQTNEVFRDYELFFKRTILCNSLVWSCEVTAKHNLTYEEAIDCEKEARTTALNIPLPIQRGALTLVHYTRHSRLDHLCDEVCTYIRDRFQEGEEVDVKYNNGKYVGFIHNVIEPILTNGYKSPKSGKSPKIKSPKTTSNTSDDIIIIPDDDSKKVEHCKSPRTSTFPDAKTYQYQIKMKNYETYGVPEMITVKQPKISRKKGAFSREKLRLLLRVTCLRTSPAHEDGYWKVNDEYREKFDLSADVDQNVFIPTKNSRKRKETTEVIDTKSKKRKKSVSGEIKEKDVKKMTADEIEEMKKQKLKEKEEQRKMREADKETKKKERDKARLEKQEILKEQKMFLLQWCAPQEDLDLTDLRELPTSQPIQCKFPGEMFGNMVMVLEFLQIFGEFFDIKNDFPDGVTFDMLEKALTEHDAEGIFYDIIRFLLDNILKIHAEEEEDEGLDDSEFPKESFVDSNEEQSDCDVSRLNKAVSASATMAASWAQLHQGRNLHEINLDPFTLSEILRLHFLSSGANLLSDTDGETYRWQRRGGFTISDDAGVAFRHNEHNIMRGLVTDNIYGLQPENKLKIMSTLSTQLLTYATARDIIDDGFDRWRKAKRELQEMQWADQRKDKKEAALKIRKIKEERAKAKEEREKEKERKMAEMKGKTNKTKEPEKADEVKEHDNSKENELCDLEMEDKAYTRSQGRVLEDGMKVDKQDNEEYEREERKELLRKNEKAYFEELRKSQAMSSVQPLGCDRIFRRYWIFNSMKGLFIEQTDYDYQQLLKPSIKELKDEESSDEDSGADDDSMSDSIEEDASSNTTTQDSITNQVITCSLTKDQIKEEKELCRILKLYAIPLECLAEHCPLTKLNKYEKRDENMANTKPADSQWSYINKKEVLDQLLNALNPRGHRERVLRENIVQHYDTIVNGLEDNPVSKEVQSIVIPKDIPKRGRRRQSQAVDKTLYETMEDFIEANLRDQILDLENRIYHAAFGVVKVPDITVWRKEVENDIYKFLPDNTTSENNPAENEDQMNGDDSNMVNGTNRNDGDKMDVDVMVEDVVVSRPGTPIDGSFISTPTSSLTPQAINPCVRMLANVVLQLEEGIERKYLIPPLGDDEDTKKRKMQEAADAAENEFNEMMNISKKKKTSKTPDENENNDNNSPSTKEVSVSKTQKTLLERWRGSLLSSTNLSQVFIHLSTLDNSIAWDKSVLNAHCRICRRKGDAEYMLLCDGCDRGHHMYCLKPPIKEIPDGDWFCEICRPKETRRSIRKACRKSEESENEEEDYDTKRRIEEAESDDSSDSEFEEESDDEEEGKEEDSDEEGSIHMETCACCDGEGELLCCETCPLAFHLECAYPPLRRIPRGDWVCQVCTGSENELPSGRRVKKSVIKEARKKSKDVTPPATKKVKIPARKKDAKTATTNRRQSNTTPKTTASTRGKKTPTTSLNQSKVTPVTSKQAKSTPSSAQTAKSKATATNQSTTPSDKTPKNKWTAAQSKKCGDILKELQNHDDAILFLYPVDQTEVPDYHLIIESPMDLNTIQTKLSSREYNTIEQFVADIRQIFFNCAEYNKPRSREARAGIRLSAFFEARCVELGFDPSEPSVPRTRRSR